MCVCVCVCVCGGGDKKHSLIRVRISHSGRGMKDVLFIDGRMKCSLINMKETIHIVLSTMGLYLLEHVVDQ